MESRFVFLPLMTTIILAPSLGVARDKLPERVKVTGSRIDGEVYLPELDDIDGLLASIGEGGSDGSSGSNGGSGSSESAEEKKQRIKKKNSATFKRLNKFIDKFLRRVDRVTDILRIQFQFKSDEDTRTTTCPDGTVVEEKDGALTICLGNGNIDCSHVKLEKVNKFKHSGVRIAFSSLHLQENSEGKQYLVSYQDDTSYITINHENGDEVMNQLTNLFKVRPEVQFACGKTVHNSIRTKTFGQNNNTNGKTYWDEQCKYSEMKLIEARCDSGYSLNQYKACKPSSCGLIPHGERLVGNESNCRNGIIQYTYENCSFGEISYTYETKNCEYDTIGGGISEI